MYQVSGLKVPIEQKQLVFIAMITAKRARCERAKAVEEG